MRLLLHNTVGEAAERDRQAGMEADLDHGLGGYWEGARETNRGGEQYFIFQIVECFSKPFPGSSPVDCWPKPARK